MMNYSRCHAANRILRFYVACYEPSFVLKKLVEYIVNVYIPVWFADKKEFNFSNGPIHFVSFISSAEKLSSNTRSVLKTYFAMMHDPNHLVKKLGWKSNFKSRKIPSHSARQLILKIPIMHPKPLIFCVQNYFMHVPFFITGRFLTSKKS